MKPLGNSWDTILKEDFAAPSYLNLRGFLKEEYASRTVYPPPQDIYNALRLTPYEAVRVVILGQDPYHGAGQAHGLAFSVPDGVPMPPSLQNIFKELQTDLGCTFPKSGCLDGWAAQGVLLLNTSLTVRAAAPASHGGKGWEALTDAIVRRLAARPAPMVFLLWGSHAKAKASMLAGTPHLVLTAAHPSPLSAFAGFFGCRHFSKANAFLTDHNQPPVNWQL